MKELVGTARWARAGGLAVLSAVVGLGLVAGPALATPALVTSPSLSSTTAHEGQPVTLTQGKYTSGGSLVVTDQWQSCDPSNPTQCIAPAGNVNGTTYTPAEADVGRTIKVSETASDGALPDSSPVIAGPTSAVTPLPLQNLGPPQITPAGTPHQGQTLTATTGIWTDQAIDAFTYQWQRCQGLVCDTLGNATSPTYTPTLLDAGYTLRVIVSATNSGGGPVTATSNPTTVVLPQPPAIQSPPQILGSVAQGETLVALSGGWSGNPASFTYQWLRCDGAGNGCAAIGGQTSQTYPVSTTDVGHALRVAVSAINPGGTGGPTPSAPTSPVAVEASSTSLLAVPATLLTNQAVTLLATVTSSTSADRPAGTVTFENRGVAIAGCVNQAVAPTDQSVTVSCQTSFAASTSPEQLTAVFRPTAGASVGGSTGPAARPYSLLVRPDSTSTGLQVSNPTIKVGGSATYTATVTPSNSGPARPSGSVAFLDGGQPIAACAAQPLSSAGGFLTASCRVAYKKSGTHSITARYGGDSSFGGSNTSQGQAIDVHNPPGHCCVTALMQWTFNFTRTFTKVASFIETQVPVGGSVLVNCHGRGCPFARYAVSVRKAKVCRVTAKHRCTPQRPATFNLAGRFRGRRLAVGTRLTVQLVLPGWVGKYYRFTIRARRAPSVQIACLAPGSSRPGVGC